MTNCHISCFQETHNSFSLGLRFFHFHLHIEGLVLKCFGHYSLLGHKICEHSDEKKDLEMITIIKKHYGYIIN